MVHKKAKKKAKKKGKKVAVALDMGWTPFHEAANFGHLKVCKFLMEYISDINESNDWGVSAIHLAAKDDHLKVCKLLIKNGADVNARTDNTRMTPLHGAAKSGAVSTCKLLMENMEDKNPSDFYSWTPYQFAAKRGHLKVCKLFKDNLGCINYDFGFVNGSPLHLALENGHLEVCKLITDNVEDKDLNNKPISSFVYLFMVMLLLGNKLKIVSFITCSCRIFIPIICSNWHFNCANLSDLQNTSRKKFKKYAQKLFSLFSVQINCFSR